MTYSESTEHQEVCKNHHVRCFGVKPFWCWAEPTVYNAQLCSRWSSSTPSLHRLICWKAVFVISLGSPPCFSDSEVWQGEGRSRYRSQAALRVVNVPTEVCGIVFRAANWSEKSSRCSALRNGIWSVSGFVSWPKGALVNCVSSCFVCWKLSGELRAAYSGWKHTENAADEKSPAYRSYQPCNGSYSQRILGINVFLTGESFHPYRSVCRMKAVINLNECLLLMSEAYPTRNSFTDSENKCFFLLLAAALCGVGHLPKQRDFPPTRVPPKMSP